MLPCGVEQDRNGQAHGGGGGRGVEGEIADSTSHKQNKYRLGESRGGQSWRRKVQRGRPEEESDERGMQEQ